MSGWSGPVAVTVTYHHKFVLCGDQILAMFDSDEIQHDVPSIVAMATSV